MNSNDMVTHELKRMNEEREEAARRCVRDCLIGIVQQQAAIKAANEKIAAFRKSLSEVKYEPVTATEVLGTP